MHNTILQTLFLDNPEISTEISHFCAAVPGYAQAERDFKQAALKLQELIGYEQYSQFEEAMNWHLALENRACYLFGLGLREKLIENLSL